MGGEERGLAARERRSIQRTILVSIPASFPFTTLFRRLFRKRVAERTGLEPATSNVTGWRSNRLNYRSRLVWRAVKLAERQVCATEKSACASEIPASTRPQPIQGLAVARLCEKVIQARRHFLLRTLVLSRDGFGQLPQTVEMPCRIAVTPVMVCNHSQALLEQGLQF